MRKRIGEFGSFMLMVAASFLLTHLMQRLKYLLYVPVSGSPLPAAPS